MIIAAEHWKEVRATATQVPLGHGLVVSPISVFGPMFQLPYLEEQLVLL